MKVKEKLLSTLHQIKDWIVSNKMIAFLFMCGAIVNLGIIVFNGSYYCIKDGCGIYIGGLHFHDSLWHLALANSAFQSFPFQIPVFSGVPLQGYNYFLDLIIFILTKINIPAIVSYFKLIPIVCYILLCYFVYIYAKKINKSKIFVSCFLFFVFFGSSFSYVLSLYHFRSFSSYFYSQAMQSGRMFLNLQYAVSLVPFFGALLLLKNKKLTNIHLLLLGISLFLTAAFKLYGGVILFFLIMMDFFIRFLLKRKYTQWIFYSAVLSLFFIAVIILFYNPFLASKSGAIFTFSPFALTRPMIEAKDFFYLPNLVQARYFLQSINPFSPRLFAIELLGTALFIIFNNGTRIIGFFYIVKRFIKGELEKDEIVLISTILFSTLLTVLLVQKGTWWNVVQFYGYTLLLMNYFAALFLYKLFISKKRTISIIMAVCIILFTLPTNIEQVILAFERQISIPRTELTAMEKLKNMPPGIVLALPLQDTAYVSAFSQKQQYMADEGVLTIVGVDGTERIKRVKNIDDYGVPLGVEYLYIKKQSYKNSFEVANFKTNFENSDVIIKVRK